MGRKKKPQRMMLARSESYIWIGKQKGLEVKRVVDEDEHGYKRFLHWLITNPDKTVNKFDGDLDMIEYVKGYGQPVKEEAKKIKDSGMNELEVAELLASLDPDIKVE